MNIINLNQLVLIMHRMVDIVKAIIRTVTPKLTGDMDVRQEKNSVMTKVFKVNNVIGYPYNKRGSSSGIKILCAVYTIL